MSAIPGPADIVWMVSLTSRERNTLLVALWKMDVDARAAHERALRNDDGADVDMIEILLAGEAMVDRTHALVRKLGGSPDLLCFSWQYPTGLSPG